VSRFTSYDNFINSFILVNFRKYVDYTKDLKFTQDPDYDYLRNLFLGVLKDEKLSYDYNYEWLKIEKSSSNDDEEKVK